MNEEEYKNNILEKVESNSISLNAIHYINPTDEAKIMLADTILEWLDKKSRLLPASYITSKNETLKELAEITPILYLQINKS